LVVPTFYDSIEIKRDSMIAKFLRREQRWNTFVAFVMTFIEALLTLLLVRFVFRMLMWPLRLRSQRR
ncbi:hypothetical protein, partial [Undibacterium luofuense]